MTPAVAVGIRSPWPDEVFYGYNRVRHAAVLQGAGAVFGRRAWLGLTRSFPTPARIMAAPQIAPARSTQIQTNQEFQALSHRAHEKGWDSEKVAHLALSWTREDTVDS